MLDSHVRPLIDPPLNAIGKKLAGLGFSANTVTFLGLIFGIFAMYEISNQSFNLAITFIVLNRLCDGLDGAIARSKGLTDFGGFIDIVSDFIVYSGVVFSFCLADPSNSPYAAFLIFSFIGPISSFLAYAIIASKCDVNTNRRGLKSFYYLGGICEGTETAFVLILLCITPTYFNLICLAYGILCWITTLGRIYCAWSDFGSTSSNAYK